MSLKDDQPAETPVPAPVPAVPAYRPGNRGDLWTADEIRTLKALRAVGVSFRKISERLGKTRNGCIGKANRLGLPQLRAVKTALNPQAINAARERSAKVHVEPKIADAPLPDINAGAVGRVSFEQLEDCHCRWPVDTPSGVAYCGANKVPGLSWCEPHAKRVFSQAELKPLISPKPRPAVTHPISVWTAVRLLTG